MGGDVEAVLVLRHMLDVCVILVMLNEQSLNKDGIEESLMTIKCVYLIFLCL